MAITLSDFDNIWASSSPLTPYSFTDSNYKEGWNFIGSTPPSRQMWDFLQKNNDEKAKYIVDNYLALSGGTMTGNIILSDGGNPLSTAGGTMTGTINTSESQALKKADSDNYIQINSGVATADGANLVMCAKGYSGGLGAGSFQLTARDSNEYKILFGKPDGTLTWNGKNVLTDNVQAINSLNNIITFNSGYTLRGGTLHLISNFLVMLKLGVIFTNSVSANTLVTIGTLASEYRPPNEAFGGGSDVIVYINTDGSIAVRTLVAKSSGSWVWSTILYTLI